MGIGSSSQDLADALLIIFKTNSSVTDSKVSKGFPVKDVSGQAVGFGGGKLFLMVQIFSLIRKDIQKEGRQSQMLKEEVYQEQNRPPQQTVNKTDNHNNLSVTSEQTSSTLPGTEQTTTTNCQQNRQPQQPVSHFRTDNMQRKTTL